MKNLYLLIIILTFLAANCNNSNSIDTKSAETASKLFNISKTISDNDNGKLLGFKLYAPIVFISANGKTIYANEANKGLEPLNDVFTGNLPENINIERSSMIWENKKWLVFNLSQFDGISNQEEKLATELVRFHEANIGLNLISKQECTHLKNSDGKFWMKMETEALKMALKSTDQKEQTEHLRLALAARKVRKMTSVKTFKRENDMDLKEGIPVLAGILLNKLTYEENRSKLINELNEFQKSNNLEESFYNYIFPAYGLVMSLNDTEWLKKLNHETDIMNFIIKYYQFEYLESFPEMMKMLNDKYHKDEFKHETAQ